MMRSPHSGNSIKRRLPSLMMESSVMLSRAHRKIAPRVWMSGALKKKTIVKLFMSIWSRTRSHIQHMMESRYGMQYTKKIV